MPGDQERGRPGTHLIPEASSSRRRARCSASVSGCSSGESSSSSSAAAGAPSLLAAALCGREACGPAWRHQREALRMGWLCLPALLALLPRSKRGRAHMHVVSLPQQRTMASTAAAAAAANAAASASPSLPVPWHSGSLRQATAEGACVMLVELAWPAGWQGHGARSASGACKSATPPRRLPPLPPAAATLQRGPWRMSQAHLRLCPSWGRGRAGRGRPLARRALAGRPALGRGPGCCSDCRMWAV